MINFDILEDELLKAVAADEKYERENSAKFRAVEQRVATYDEFREIVNGSHLKPLEKKEKLVDPDIAQQKRIWNSVASKSDGNTQAIQGNQKKKHFTERQ